VAFMKSFPRGESGDRTWTNHPISLTLIAFFFTSIIALPLHKLSEKHLENVMVMAWTLLIGGILMWVIDARASRYEATTIHVEEMSLGQSIWIGICQSLSAVFPGTSRSMSTIAAGQLVGMDRPSALEFSFLLSIPTMIAATAWDLLKSIHPGKTALASGAVPMAEVSMNGQRWIVLVIGFVVSFLVALGVVEWFLAWVRRHGFTVFAVYRIALGILLLVLGKQLLGGSF
jgi:undecaprenyl-diphosphatase